MTGSDEGHGDTSADSRDVRVDSDRRQSLDTRGAYILAVRGDLHAMRSEAARVSARIVPRIVLDAAIAQNEGRMDRCRSLYERALRSAPSADLPFLVDLISPFLMMDGDYDRYEKLRDSCVVNVELAGMFAAMDAISMARLGNISQSLEAARRSLELAEDSENELLNGRLLQRLAYAALHRSDFTQAAELATRSARTLEAIGAHRPAAMAYTIAYNAYHAGTGDIDRAETFAGKIIEAARRSGDASLENVGLIAQYEIACECGEHAAAQRLRNRIDSLALPEQYAERFARGVGDVILAAISNDLAAFYANAVLLRDALATDRPMLALASALRSLGAAALGDFEDARRSSRNALGLSALTDVLEPAYSVRYRRLARTLAAATCVLIGDEVRAQRATARHFARDPHGLLMLLTIAQGGDPQHTPRRIRGYARVISTVREAITGSFRRSVLSEAEYTVLTLLACGMSAPQIAAQTDRSVHTIRSHTRAIIGKFGVRGRSAAIAYAYKNGLLTPTP